MTHEIQEFTPYPAWSFDSFLSCQRLNRYARDLDGVEASAQLQLQRITKAGEQQRVVAPQIEWELEVGIGSFSHAE